MKEEMLDEMELYPYAEAYQPEESFRSPPPHNGQGTWDTYILYVNELPPDSPIAFGLHPNAEIAVKNVQAEALFTSILELQPRSGGAAAGSSPIVVVGQIVNSVQSEIKGIKYDLTGLKQLITPEGMGPYQNVLVQEAERMNILAQEIRRSLVELALGLSGELQMSQPMEDLMNSLFLGRVPASWGDLAYPSMRPLSTWLINLTDREGQITDWKQDPLQVPKVLNLAHFFNPQSFLTAIMQKFAQNTGSPLDKLTIATNVTRKTVAQTDSPARSGGAYVHGLYLEGAKWNWNQMLLEESEPRKMFFEMPVIGCHAILRDRIEKNGIYMCPVFKTQIRGPTFVFFSTLRTKLPVEKWILGGVVMVFEADD